LTVEKPLTIAARCKDSNCKRSQGSSWTVMPEEEEGEEGEEEGEEEEEEEAEEEEEEEEEVQKYNKIDCTRDTQFVGI
jgi:hypothetical protein